MTWAKLSDDYSDDCWTLSDAAFRLHTEGLIWSNRKLLDCVLPKDDLRRFAKRSDAVQELLDTGFWQESKDGGSYIIRHHADYQRDREAVIAQQEANRANGKKGGRPPGIPPGQKTQLVSQSATRPVKEPPIEAEVDPMAWTAEEFEKSRLNAGKKTQSLSEPPTESETERDRTGQAFNNTSTYEPKPTGWQDADLDPFSREPEHFRKAWPSSSPAPAGPQSCCRCGKAEPLDDDGRCDSCRIAW